jgi:hypothetical protein
MKSRFLIGWCGLCSLSLLGSVNAAIIAISGVIETVPGNFSGRHGETIDYLKFEMLSTGNFSLKVPDMGSTGRFYTLAAFTGDNTQFGGLLGASVLGLAEVRQAAAAGTIPTLSRSLERGTYILIVDAYVNSQYDFGDGFVPVNVDGGFFPTDRYSFTIEGDVRGIEFWEGQLDPQPFGSFKITIIPEPSSAALLGGSTLLLWQRNASNRKENKALLRTPRGWLVSTLSLIRKCLGFGGVQSRP